MSDGASAISDALERSMCLAPAGEKVAVLSLGDALLEHGGSIPNYGEVAEIGHFSVEDDEYVDSAVHRRYLRKPFPQNREWDLNKGYESALRRNFSSRSSHLLNWVRLHKDKVMSVPSPDEERFLTALEDCRTVYLFEYIPRSGEIVCKRLTDLDEAYQPRKDLPGLFEDVGSVQNS